MDLRKLLITASLILSGLMAYSQQDAHFIKGDTIYIKKDIIGNGYYLDGRKLNNSVIEWLVKDNEEAHLKIQKAIRYDQLSVASFGFGGLFLLSGFSLLDNKSSLGPRLLKAGGISMGTGILFQIFEGRSKKQAVAIYNKSLLQLAGLNKGKIKVTLGGNQAKLTLIF